MFRAEGRGLQKRTQLGEGGDLILREAPVGVRDEKIQRPVHRQAVLPGGGKKTVHRLLAEGQGLPQNTGGQGVAGGGGGEDTGQKPDLLHLIVGDILGKHGIGIQLAGHEADKVRGVVGGIGALAVYHAVECPQHLGIGAVHAQDPGRLRDSQRPGKVLRIRQRLQGRHLFRGIRRDHGTDLGILCHFLREEGGEGGKGHGHGGAAGMPDGIVLQQLRHLILRKIELTGDLPGSPGPGQGTGTFKQGHGVHLTGHLRCEVPGKLGIGAHRVI